MNSLLPIKQEPMGAPGSGELSAHPGQTVVLTEALAEAGTDGVEGLGKHIEWYTSLYSSMPDTRAIEVHFDTVFARVFRNTNHFVLWKYRPIKCIL
jgi:hypothetical protein